MRWCASVVCALGVALVGVSVGCAQPPAAGGQDRATPTAPAALAPIDDARARSAAWCVELLEALASREVSRDEVIALFGRAGAPSTRRTDGTWTSVTPRARAFSHVEVGPLTHIRIPVRVEVDLREPLSFAEVERALGSLGRVPPDPHPTSRLTFSHHRRGAYASARIFVEVERADPTRVVLIEIDATPFAR